MTAAAVTVLWWSATAGLTGPDLVNARLNALKIGLSGGVVALCLAWRRQHSAEADLDDRERPLAQQYEVLAHRQAVAATTQAHQERVADDARADATARRITELMDTIGDGGTCVHAVIDNKAPHRQTTYGGSCG
ncbi:hypothetical protein [Amycolatopsis sp. NPDC051071]|uniref:hypothetical protein n=1 Tax=Amycolatopsis sp. NPDC051071 TaxID=3154637 RepID=UPI00344AFDA4